MAVRSIRALFCNIKQFCCKSAIKTISFLHSYLDKDRDPTWLPVSLCLQKRNVFINRCSAQIAHSGKFADIQMSAFICGIMPKEDCGNAVFGGLRPADLLVLGLCVCHPWPLIGAALPSRQSMVILPTIMGRRSFARIMSIKRILSVLLPAHNDTSISPFPVV